MKHVFQILVAAVALLWTVPLIGQIDEHGPVDRGQRNEQKKEREDKPTFKERLTFGGNVGAYFGTNTYVNINPLVGYKLQKNWVAGLGLNYVYYNNPSFQGSLLGKSIWSRYYFLQHFFAHTELESIQYARTNFAELNKRNVNVALVGLGYQSNYFGISIMYDLIQDPYSPYSSPLIRVGGMFGIGN